MYPIIIITIIKYYNNTCDWNIIVIKINVGRNVLYAACVVGNLFHWYFCWIFNYQTGSTGKVNYFLVLKD